MAKRYYGSYEGKENREAIESSDGSMIGSGKGAFANMPTGVIMREYPKVSNPLPEHLNDGPSGIDKQIRQDTGKANKFLQRDGKK